MLAMLYAKALDADAPNSILRDQHAKAAVAGIDYDWQATGINAQAAPSVAVRSLHFDTWTRQFLAVHEHATVLHLGCGLDARVHRLDPPAGVRWYDIDYPEVIELRERLYPGRVGYRMVAASVTDPSWLDEIPANNPALLLGEGLTPYLTRDDGLALLRRVVDRFPSANCSSMRSAHSGTACHGSPIPSCAARVRDCTGRSTGPPTSSMSFPRRVSWPGNHRSTATHPSGCHR